MQCSCLVGSFLKPHAADLSRDPHTSEHKPLCQASAYQSLSSDSRMEGHTEGSMVWGPLLTLPVFNPSHPVSPSPFSLTLKGGVGRKVVDHQVAVVLIKNPICCQLHLPIFCATQYFGLLLMGLLRRIIVFQIFNPQVTKINIYICIIFIISYIWITHSGGAGWWSYLNLDLPFGLPQSCWGRLLGVVKSQVWCDFTPAIASSSW